MSIPSCGPQMFGWVKPELWEYIKRIENSATRVRHGADIVTLNVASDSLHKVYGILRILDLNAICLFVEDLALLNQRMVEQGDSSQMEHMLSRFIVGIGEVKTYLYAIESESPQSPLALVASINAVRKLTNRTRLALYDLFAPSLDLNLKISHERTLRLTDSERINLLFHLRQRFRQSLLHWLSHDNQQGMLSNISEVLDQLKQVSKIDVLKALWVVAKDFVDVMRRGELSVSNEVKAQFANLDLEITRMKDESNESIKQNPPQELLKQMLFYIGSGVSNAVQAGGLVHSEVYEQTRLEQWFVFSAEDTKGIRDRELERKLGELADVFSSSELYLLETGLEECLTGDKSSDTNVSFLSLLQLLEGEARERGISDLANLVETIMSTIKTFFYAGRNVDGSNSDLRLASAVLVSIDGLRRPPVSSVQWLSTVNACRSDLLALIGDGDDEFKGIVVDARYVANEVEEAKNLLLREIVNRLRSFESVIYNYQQDGDLVNLSRIRSGLSELTKLFVILEANKGLDLARSLILTIDAFCQDETSLTISPAQREQVAFVIASLQVYADELQYTDNHSDRLIDNARAALKSMSVEGCTEEKLYPESSNSDSSDSEDGALEPGLDSSYGQIETLQTDGFVDLVGSQSVLWDDTSETDKRFVMPLLDRIDEKRRVLKVNSGKRVLIREIQAVFKAVNVFLVGQGQQEAAEFAELGESTMEALNGEDLDFDESAERFVKSMCDRVRQEFCSDIEQIEGDSGQSVQDWQLALNVLIDSARAKKEEQLVAERLQGNRNGDWKRSARAQDVSSEYEESESPKRFSILFSDELRQIFVGELKEHTLRLKSSYRSLVSNAENIDTLSYQETFLRSVHALAGNCRSIQFDSIAICVEALEPIVHSQASFNTFSIRFDELFEGAIGLLDRAGDEIRSKGVLPENIVSELRFVSQTLLNATADLLSEENIEKAHAGPDIRVIFLDESKSILSRVNQHLSEWRAGELTPEMLISIRREFHTLKGSAGATGFDNVSILCHNVESFLDQEEVSPHSEQSSLLNLLEEIHDGLASELGFIPAGAGNHMRSLNKAITLLLSDESLRRELKEPPSRGIEKTSTNYSTLAGDDASVEDSQKIPSLANEYSHARLGLMEKPMDSSVEDGGRLPRGLRKEEPMSSPLAFTMTQLDEFDEMNEQSEAGFADNSLRIENKKLSELVNHSGELGLIRTQLKNMLEQTRKELDVFRDSVRSMKESVVEIESESEALVAACPMPFENSIISGGIDSSHRDRFVNLQTQTETLNSQLGKLLGVEKSLDDRASELGEALLRQFYLGEQLQSGLMSARMSSINEHMPRLRQLVREASRKAKKPVNFIVIGGEIEVDRQVIGTMIAPFEHMIRNAIAHGIEPSSIRSHENKNLEGQLQLKVTQQGTELFVELKDDGRGLDYYKIAARAVRLGFAKNMREVTDDHLLQVIVQPGYSTEEVVSLESGRGVGMNVVYQSVRNLGGSLSVSTQRGHGTSFQFRLPVTLSVTQALLVRLGDYRCAILSRTIERIIEVRKSDLINVGGVLHLNFNDRRLPILDLPDRMEVAGSVASKGTASIIVIRLADRVAAFSVDGFEETVDIVSKTPGTQLVSINGVSGVTVLADSSIVLILDPGQFIETMELETQPLVIPKLEDGDEASKRLKQVLIVDDSPVLRTVMQRDINSIGLEALVARNGIEALETLNQTKVDIVLVDIEMPEMGGYEFLVELRKDPRFDTLPVVVITSRSDEQHRDKALYLGADDYINRPYNVFALAHIIKKLISARGRKQS
ncbi:MAG: response regulator [Gammaproteobacteria bacterium]|nr:response regulator [Gammaproteobacteria bacterium]